MPNYQSETVSTVTCRFTLQLPSNAVEVSKMEAAAARAWRNDKNVTETITVPDDAITVTVEDDVLVYSWTVSNTEVHKPSPVPLDDDRLCTCGHAWTSHSNVGCLAMVNPEDDNLFCSCETPKPGSMS